MSLRRPLVAAVALVAVVAGVLPALAATRSSAPSTAAVVSAHPGLARLDVTRRLDGRLSGVATFAHRPSGRQVAALRRLGLGVQPTRNLPLAYVLGTRAQLVAAVRTGLARDVYPNERLQWESVDSDQAIKANAVHKEGYTGKGVGIAIVDSGIDATHPALKDRVTHNVKIIDAEYVVNQSPGTAGGPFVVPVDKGPYNNSDSASGHGTHCAGIAAADGHGDPKLVGVAPGADLIGYSTGEAVFVWSVVGAFDDILTHHKAWHIRVVSNSWGSSFRLFDPNEPINVATKKLHDAGLTVVFAAGNDYDPMTQNPYSVAPWVIAVAAGTKALQQADFTSGGIVNDNSYNVHVSGAISHEHFAGSRIGLYHPDVTAPGVDIVSTGTPTGTIVTETPPTPGGEATASGTSMATPHVAGAAAVLLQARHTLTPDQVREVLQVSARPLRGGSPFYYTGFGYVDLQAAVKLVTGRHFSSRLLARMQQAADRRVLHATPYRVRATDFWQFPAAPVTVGGVPDYRTYKVPVTSATKALQAMVAYPSTGYVGVNEWDYTITVKDAAGTTVAQSKPSASAGQSALFVDLANHKVAYGTWTVELSGDLGTSDQDTLEGKNVTLTVAQLARQPVAGASKPRFRPTGTLDLRLQPNGNGTAPSPEGCPSEAGVATGGLSTAHPKSCEAGQVGFAATLARPAVFTSAPLRAPVTIGGKGTLVQWLADPAGPAYQPVFIAWTIGSLDAVLPNGTAVGLVSIEDQDHQIKAGPTASADKQAFTVDPIVVPKGARLRLSLSYGGVYDSAMRLVWGAKYDSGVRLTVGRLG